MQPRTAVSGRTTLVRTTGTAGLSAINNICTLPIPLSYCINSASVHSVANTNQPTYIPVLTSLAFLTTVNKQFLQYQSHALLYLLQMFQIHGLKTGKVKQSHLYQRAFEFLNHERVSFCVSVPATVGSQCYLLEIETSGKNACCASI